MMRRALVLSVIAAMSFGAVACGGIVDPSPNPTPLVMPAGTVSVPWRLAREDPDRLIIAVMNGGCYRFQEARVSADPTHVQILALARDRSGPDVACTSNLEFDFGEVALDEAVGTRPLIHAPVLEEWADPRLADAWPEDALLLARADHLYPQG